ncbi:DUF5647 family protein [Thermus thalpophilus]|uniref:DUF5647 family protein n=1 Tax=Thermus thalpophilus TaxID=2908147 RepID=UPI001FA98FAD|nr:DUF5647 family protein [Thermus thalpophilus]
MLELSPEARRVMKAGAEVSALLYRHPEVTAFLPRRYRLVILLLEDPEALAWSLGQGSGEEPVVYALVRGNRVEGLLTPHGPLALRAA